MSTQQSQCESPPIKRRYFRYSVRTLFIVATLLCVLLGTVVRQARIQRFAVEAILEKGGEVVYLHQDTKSVAPGPEWLREIIGDEYFFRVNRVTFIFEKADDTALAVIGKLTDLKGLAIAEAQITSAGLKHLARLTDLESLELQDTLVTSDDLVNLKGLTYLKSLQLNNTKVTDDSIEHLKELTHLEGLWLVNTQISDAGLVDIRDMISLQMLFLNGTQITDAGLDNLESLTNLRTLTLSDTQVTVEGVKKLQQAIPKCKIYASHH